eukprot:CAMPEP_0194244612 /NCGR_PEP_ID=MMETSP0158-20130606/11651_1 /TAXON_ID=33649 /ORGANISM="Thalassionema nitzschioides, Strain L26-B" /LENGTH=294 /DNA_ID=CAMNT_0038980157 /DNA_START=56 /DNA_END=937 /DNA_ORIENTATION=+
MVATDPFALFPMHRENIFYKAGGEQYLMKHQEKNVGKRKLSDSEENESDSDPQNIESSLGPPRKKVYKSTLRKRNREKRRRDQFNEGLQQLADIVFSIDPSVVSGRDSVRISESTPSTSVTNRGELMQTAVDGMRRLVREHSEQQKEIVELKQALASERAKFRLMASGTNSGFAGRTEIEQQRLQNSSSNTPGAKILTAEGLSSLANGPVDILGLTRYGPNPLFSLMGNNNVLHSVQRQQQPQGPMHSVDSVLRGIPNRILPLHRNGIPSNADILTQSLLVCEKERKEKQMTHG